MQPFTIEDVNITCELQPHVPRIKILRNFAFLNLKIRQGWTKERIVSYVGLCLSEQKTTKN